MTRDDKETTSASRHARLKKLFFTAIELEDEDRRRFLEDACGEDAELRTELESLLGHHRRADLPEDFWGPQSLH